MHVRVRFAPSPTGRLHLGGARTALFNYLFARQHGGSMILRIEDTDTARHNAEATATFLEGLRWLGISWDEGPDKDGPHAPYVSSQRQSFYQAQLQRLLTQGRAYPCFCSQEQLDALRQEARQQGQPFRYPGTCRMLTADEVATRQAAGETATYRFRIPPRNQNITFHDLVRGNVSFAPTDLGDFVIAKANQHPLYNLAATVDDIAMGITHIIRGEEHLSNTPLQILLYEALGYESPVFAHLPLLLNQEGRKLSKRDETTAQFVDEYRQRGFLPAAMVNFLALLGWSPGGEREVFSLPELVQRFSLERVQQAGAILDTKKLTWMNGQYIREMPLSDLVDLALPYLAEAGFVRPPLSFLPAQEQEQVRSAVHLFQSAIHEIQEIVPQTEFIFRPNDQIEPAAQELLQDPAARSVAESFLAEIKEKMPGSPTEIKGLLQRVRETTGCRGKKLFLPIRACSTGRIEGPELPLLLSCLGAQEVLRRTEIYLGR